MIIISYGSLNGQLCICMCDIKAEQPSIGRVHESYWLPSPVISITDVTLTFDESMPNNVGYNISWIKSKQIYD